MINKFYKKVKPFFSMKFKRGSVVILLIFALGVAAATTTYTYWQDAHQRYAVARNVSEGYRAKLIAIAGFQAGLSALKVVPEEYLFTSGMALSPPDIEMKNCTPEGEASNQKCFISYRIQPEDGKINLNYLVRREDDQPSERYLTILQRLCLPFQIPVDNIDALVDWIDTNNYTYARGAEKNYYESLKPPSKIKNAPLYSLPELAAVKGWNRNMIYEPRYPSAWRELQKNVKSLSEDEKELLTDDDWILANNITAYYTTMPADRININAARYHVLMSLSDFMSREAVMEIFKYRKKNSGYIKNIRELKNLPAFKRTLSGSKNTLYDELAGSESSLSGMIKTKGEIYRITGVGSIYYRSDNKNSKQAGIVRKVVGLYDVRLKKLIYYSED